MLSFLQLRKISVVGTGVTQPAKYLNEVQHALSPPRLIECEWRLKSMSTVIAVLTCTSGRPVVQSTVIPVLTCTGLGLSSSSGSQG